jgi:anti-sigma factor RsiW
MSDRPFNYELDDELLSAYLDGELSADERAAVEARLATDPAAQQLLHELRSVSQSVQALPTESLGRDVSDEVIRRAHESAPRPGTAPSAKTVAASEQSRAGHTMPKIRIFHSKRAWIWASMALAAGLLLMIVQSGDEPAKKLPPLAARNREAAQTQPVDEAGQPRRREISTSAAPKSRTAPPANIASDSELHEKVESLSDAMPAAPVAGETSRGQLSRSNREGPAASPPVAAATRAPELQQEVEKTVLKSGDASSTITASPSQMALDRHSDTPQPGGGPGGPPGIDAKQKSESFASSNPQRFVVVRVVAKPEALKNGTFERLLAVNKIEFVPQPAKNEPLAFGGGKLAKPAQRETYFKEELNKAAEAHAVDMVLVEAPAPTIESCLAELNKNTNDFPSIAVNEDPQVHDRFDAKSTPNKKPAENSTSLSRFGRGSVSASQKDTIDPREYFYSYDFDKANEPVADGSPRAGGFGGEAGTISGVEQNANGEKKRSDKSQPLPEVRRARGTATWRIENRQAGEPASAGGRAARIQSGAQAPNQPTSQRKPAGSAEAQADTSANDLKVLFVFTPEDSPASSALPDTRTK